ncbi:MAG: hypothetical protein LUC33_04760 [Prevotellaceae bacterium]|nr:hypothetical protein [Prevotellaceae bacterium]
MERGRNEDEKRQLCFDESNLQVLCYECHALAHSYVKRYTTPEEHREHTRALVDDFVGKFAVNAEAGGGG